MIPSTITSDPCLLALILYGSHARGDSDASSDTDICTFVRPRDYSHLEAMRWELEQTLHVQSDALSIYPISVVETMVKAGSLFLWHLRLEGQILFDRDDLARRAFERLTAFRGYSDELSLFNTLLGDVENVLSSDGFLTEIDLHLLHSVIRNTCILLTSYSGKPTFGRTSAVVQASKMYPNMPYEQDAFEQLCCWHLAYLRDRGVPGTLPSRKICRRYVSWARELVRFAGDIFK